MYTRFTVNVGGKKARKVKLEGRWHYVVPAAILPGDGVLNGSCGPLRYPADENRKSAPAWNHMPIVVDHPAGPDGSPITARCPDVLNSRKVGVILNSEYDKKLNTEAWFDIDRTNEVDGRIITKIKKGEHIECSTGLTADTDKKPGELDGVKYDGTLSNYRPDHLAVLPDKIGAYSVADGGGLFAWNVAASELPERTRQIIQRSVAEAVKRVGVTVSPENELSHSAIHAQLCDLLAGKFGERGKYWGGHVVDVFPGYVVFRSDYTGPMRRIDYTMDGDSVSLSGSAVEVERVVEYQAANSAGGDDVAFDKKKHIDGLIANSGGVWTEDDRGALEKMDEKQLAKVTAPASVTNAATTTTAEANKPDPPVANATPAPVTLENLVAGADPATQQYWAAMKRGFATQKKTYIDQIMANGRNKFSREFLEAKNDLEELAGYAAALAPDPEPDHTAVPMFQNGFYAGAAGPAPRLANAAPPTEGLPSHIDLGF